jgi:hypothetical protein
MRVNSICLCDRFGKILALWIHSPSVYVSNLIQGGSTNA